MKTETKRGTKTVKWLTVISNSNQVIHEYIGWPVILVISSGDLLTAKEPVTHSASDRSVCLRFKILSTKKPVH